MESIFWTGGPSFPNPPENVLGVHHFGRYEISNKAEAPSRGQTDKKLTSMLVIRNFLSFELADIFLNYGSLLFFKKALKTLIYILIANNDANTTP